MPADSDPMDPTSYAAAPPARCAKCGALPTDACAKTDAWCEDGHRRFALRDSPWVRDADGGEAVAPVAPLSACQCARCGDERWAAAHPGKQPTPFNGPPSMTMMVLCAICGNKRCPHATDHRHACSGSNLPGQKGGSYENAGRSSQGNQQSDEGFQRVEGGRSSEGNQSDGEWTIDLIHAHMEHLAPHGDSFDAATLDAMGWLLERVEALASENARLTADRERLRDALNQTVQEACAAIDDDLKPEIARLTEERDMLRDAVADGGRIIDGLKAEAAMLEVEAEAAIGVLTNSLMCGFSHGQPTVKELQGRITGAKDILERAVYGQPQDWYARHRAAVEAAHAAAKEADGDEAFAGVVLRQLDRAAKEGGIDMDLLGSLCREEPDEATKREAAGMMGGLLNQGGG